MDSARSKELRALLSDTLFESITSERQEDDSLELTNSTEIVCDCKTLILRPNHARLIVPTDQMLTIERELKNFQQGDRLFKDMIHGCYWLVDDMYKFEQMAYTKEINAQNLVRPNSDLNPDQQVSDNQATQSATINTLRGLRYLACAECNLCPLGWFDPTTKESYLNVWPNKT